MIVAKLHEEHPAVANAVVKAYIDKAVVSATSRAEDHVPLTEIPVCRSRNFDDMTSEARVSKRLKATSKDHLEMPKMVMEEASASAVSFGKHLASLITSQCNQAMVESYPAVVCSEQALAHLAQAFAWAAAGAHKAREDIDTKLQLQREAEASHYARLKAEKEVVDLRKELGESNKKNEDLSIALASADSTIVQLKIEVAEVKHAESNAREEWYDKGNKDGLRDCVEKVRELMPDH